MPFFLLIATPAARIAYFSWRRMIMPSVMVVEWGSNVETPLWQKRWPFCMVDFNYGLCDALV